MRMELIRAWRYPAAENLCDFRTINFVFLAAESSREKNVFEQSVGEYLDIPSLPTRSPSQLKNGCFFN